METLDFEYGRVYFKQFGAERVNRSGTQLIDSYQLSLDDFVIYVDEQSLIRRILMYFV